MSRKLPAGSLEQCCYKVSFYRHSNV